MFAEDYNCFKDFVLSSETKDSGWFGDNEIPIELNQVVIAYVLQREGSRTKDGRFYHIKRSDYRNPISSFRIKRSLWDNFANRKIRLQTFSAGPAIYSIKIEPKKRRVEGIKETEWPQTSLTSVDIEFRLLDDNGTLEQALDTWLSKTDGDLVHTLSKAMKQLTVAAFEKVVSDSHLRILTDKAPSEAVKARLEDYLKKDCPSDLPFEISRVVSVDGFNLSPIPEANKPSHPLFVYQGSLDLLPNITVQASTKKHAPIFTLQANEALYFHKSGKVVKSPSEPLNMETDRPFVENGDTLDCHKKVTLVDLEQRYFLSVEHIVEQTFLLWNGITIVDNVTHKIDIDYKIEPDGIRDLLFAPKSEQEQIRSSVQKAYEEYQSDPADYKLLEEAVKQRVRKIGLSVASAYDFKRNLPEKIREIYYDQAKKLIDMSDTRLDKLVLPEAVIEIIKTEGVSGLPKLVQLMRAEVESQLGLKSRIGIIPLPRPFDEQSILPKEEKFLGRPPQIIDVSPAKKLSDPVCTRLEEQLQKCKALNKRIDAMLTQDQIQISYSENDIQIEFHLRIRDTYPATRPQVIKWQVSKRDSNRNVSIELEELVNWDENSSTLVNLVQELLRRKDEIIEEG